MITDADDGELYGPRWRSVLEVVRQAERLTPAQIKRAAKLRVEFDGDMWAAASDATWAAAKSAGRIPSWHAGRDAAWAAARAAAKAADGTVAYDGWRSAGWCAESAAMAAVVADLVGQHGLTAEHITILAAPWRAITEGLSVTPLPDVEWRLTAAAHHGGASDGGAWRVVDTDTGGEWTVTLCGGQWRVRNWRGRELLPDRPTAKQAITAVQAVR